MPHWCECHIYLYNKSKTVNKKEEIVYCIPWINNYRIKVNRSKVVFPAVEV